MIRAWIPLLCLVCSGALQAASDYWPAAVGQKPRIAIVIDDMGYQAERARELVDIRTPLTLAIIPGTPEARQVAELAQYRGFELLLHVPMQPLIKRRSEKYLTLAMSKATLQDQLRAMLDSRPEIVGINNHEGSLLTQNSERMSWVMEVLARRKLFALDSRTSAKSVLAKVAGEYSVPHTQRDVFLDDDQDPQAIAFQFRRLRRIARNHGEALAIGHPHHATIEMLKKEIPALENEGFELVTCSALLQN